MKKGIIVLLIAVLISGLAFAGDFHGSAGITFGVDLDKHEWGFANPKFGKYSFEFALDTTPVAIGEHQTDVWAELEAKAEAVVLMATDDAVNDLTDLDLLNPGAVYTAAITKADIHVGDIVFGILNSGSAVDYAKSYYKDETTKKFWNVVAGPSKLLPGFTVTYDGWYGGFGAKGLWDDDSSTYHIWGHGKTKAFKFADDQLSAEAGGYAVLDSSDKYIGGGIKVDFATEKVKAGIAGDGVLKKGSVDFGIEGAIYATYDFLRLDIYGASAAYFANYGEDDFLKLDAKLSAEKTFDLNEDIALKVTGWVDARDTLIKALLLEIGSTQSTTVKEFTFELSEKATLKNLADADKKVAVSLDASEKVTYKAEKFTAWESVAATFDFNKDEALTALVLEAGISSTAVVENATLSLVYKTLAKKIAFKDSKGAVTASCTIPF